MMKLDTRKGGGVLCFFPRANVQLQDGVRQKLAHGVHIVRAVVLMLLVSHSLQHHRCGCCCDRSSCVCVCVCYGMYTPQHDMRRCWSGGDVVSMP